MSITATEVPPLRKHICVRASTARAFKVFTEGIDTWWPKTHHIGPSAPVRGAIEPGVGGRCYTEHTDGSLAQWGQVLEWEPPHRFVLAWMVTTDWKPEPDLGKASEVEVRFTQSPDGTTLVELEHRCFERHGEAGALMRQHVEGWTSLLELFRTELDREG
ncbi:SRPBCC family protein [Acidicapsa dinghuensis]|uniref:SRPBCC family protein n=1 Tax=Acidicapsa dinghuensis TaxID=2218256 RepID=A0ABW1EFP1_9BACT|nr:SRPBCC family protein [Acidicapsa dinghuensis]